MKRMVLLILILCLLPFSALSDYKSMTDDEIKATFYEIMEEIMSRGLWINNIIPAGFYIVGEAIPAGNYELTPLKHSNVEIYPDMEHLSNKKGRTMYLIYDEGETFVLSLVDGMTLELGANCEIKPLAFSW